MAPGAGTLDTTFDLVGGADGTFWLAARTTEGELLQRTSGVGVIEDDIFRATSNTTWVSIAVSGSSPLMLRGSGLTFTNNVLTCAP